MDWKENTLTSEDKQKIEEKINLVRLSTGIELSLVIVRSSSSYNLARLRLSALGMLLSTGIILIIAPSWGDKSLSLMAIIQLASALLGFLLSYFNIIKKYALTNKDLEKEVAFKGKEVFLTLNMPELKSQSGVLVLYHLFERKVDVVIDDHLKSKIRSNDILRIRQLACNEFKSSQHRNNLMNVLNLIEEKILHFFPEGRNPSRQFEAGNHLLWMVFK